MKEKVLVFGIGGYFHKNEKALKEDYDIVAYVDNYKYRKITYDEKVIIKQNQIEAFEGNYDVLMIMLEKVAQNMAIAKQLLLDGVVEAERIRIGLTRYDFHNEFNIVVLEDGRWDIQFSDISIIVSSEMEFWDLCSIYYEDTYFHKLNNSQRDIIIDVGMNIGDSVIYYLKKPETEKVYGFEPFFQTYLQAEENLERNHFEKGRYEIFQYGLSDHNEQKKIFYNPEISIMLSTNNKYSVLGCSDFERTHGCVLDKGETEIVIREASDAVRQIIEKHPQNNIVLKMDCEGEEYAILSNLDEKGILKNIDYITLEWHYGGKEKIEYYLNKNGFSYSGKIIRKDLGQMVAWRQETGN